MSFRGIFAIPPTPFTRAGALDLGSLRRCVELCLAAGAHGLVTPVNASEFPMLADDERHRVIETAVAAAAGKIPVVAGVAGPSTPQAVAFARQAAAAGADAVIAMPPYVHKPTRDDAIFAYYRALNDATELPIFVQNDAGPAGTPMDPQLLIRLARELEHVRYVKEESAAAGPVTSQVLAGAGKHLAGVMGGKAGRYLPAEHARGACGNMPACEVVEIQVRIWAQLEQGDEAGARDIYQRLLPLLNFELGLGVVVYKEILYRRGVIASPTVRQPSALSLDQHEQRELAGLLASLDDLLTVRL